MTKEKQKPVIAVKKKAASKPKVKKTKSKKTKRKRLPVSLLRIRSLAIVSADMAAAEVQLKVRRSLANILTEFPRLQHAWDRGRMLRNLRQLAAAAATITEAEETLGMEPGKLKELLSTDMEVADLWNEARISTIIEVKQALVSSAKEGKPVAAKQVEEILRREIAQPRVDFHHLSIAQMVDVTGKTRQTIHDWNTKHALPRNADKTYDLVEFVKWFENFVFKKADGGARRGLADMDPLKAAKAERLRVDLQRHKGQLLDRGQVIAGQISRHQNLINSLSRKAEELAMICHGCGQAKIAGILSTFFDELRGQQTQVPDELRLLPDSAKQFAELLENLKPEGDGQ